MRFKMLLRSSEPGSANARPSSSPREPVSNLLLRDLLLLSVMAAVLFLTSLGSRDLWNPNEPIYGLAIREMFEAEEWQVPTVNAQVFAEKPVLYYWAGLIAAHALGGVDELTTRLPAAVAGTLSVLLVYLWIHPYAGRRRALLGAVIFSTIYIVFWTSRSVQMDVLVLLSTLAALIPLGRMIDFGLDPWLAWIFAGTVLGLGMLAKGPVTLVIPGIVYLLHCWMARRSPFRGWPAMVAGGVMVLLVSSPWYLALWAQGRTDILYEVFFRQNFVRFTDAWDHQQPWWYYLKYLWLDMAPWSWFIPLGIGLQSRGRREETLHSLSWLWIVGVLVFFSLSDSKRAPYILPIAPAVAALVAEVFDRYASGLLGTRRAMLCRLVVAVFAALLMMAGGALAGAVEAAHPVFSRAEGLTAAANVLALALAGVGVALILALSIPRPRQRLLAPVLAAGLGGLYLVTSAFVLPAIDPLKSARSFCEELDRQVDGAEVSSYRLWAWRAEYPYYCRRVIPNIETRGDLLGYWHSGQNRFLLVEGKHVDEAKHMLYLGSPRVHRRIGGREVFLFDNGAPYQAMAADPPGDSSRDAGAGR